MYKPFLLVVLVLYSCLCDLTVATLTNVTVDDSEQSITYLPAGVWRAGQDCEACAARLEASKTYESSWHDNTYNADLQDGRQLASMVFSFVGSAVFIYGVLGYNQDTFINTTQLLLYIDHQPYPAFSFTPSNQKGFTYNTSLFAVDSLSHGPHTMVLQNGNSSTSSHVMIDYIVYTTETNATTTHAPSPTKTIASTQSKTNLNRGLIVAVGVLGGLLVIVTASSALLFYRRRSEKGAHAQQNMSPTSDLSNTFITPYPSISLPTASTRQEDSLVFSPSLSGTPPPYPASETDRLAAGGTHPGGISGPTSSEGNQGVRTRRLEKLGMLRTSSGRS